MMTEGHKQLQRWVKGGFDTQQDAAAYLNIPGISPIVLNKLLRTDRRPELEKLILIEDKAGIPIRAWADASRLDKLATPPIRSAKKGR